MVTATIYSVTVPPEGTSFVAGLGLESVLRGLLDGIPEVFPDVLSVTCEVDPGVPDEGFDPMVFVTVLAPDPVSDCPSAHQLWVAWELAHYSDRELSPFAFHIMSPSGRP